MNSKVTTAARIFLGLVFFVFGLNGFFNFMPSPPLPDTAMTYMGGLASAGYFFPVLKATEVICGLLLLANFFAPLALVILAPIMIQILLFHSFLAPGVQQVGLPIVMIAAALILAKSWMHKYAPLLSPK